MFALARFTDVREAAANAQVFSSAQGVGLSAFGNMATRGTTLASDAPLHDALRKIVSRPLLPSAVKELSGQILEEAETLVENLVARGGIRRRCRSRLAPAFDHRQQIGRHRRALAPTDAGMVGCGFQLRRSGQ